MPRRLPPLKALHSFEAAARHASFARAAEELNVTAGAVSQQVKALEAWLGLRLFHRLPRGLVLSDPGRDYLAKVGTTLDQLARATDELCARRTSDSLSISALPGFAEKWLMPRLGRFRAAWPEIEVRVSATDHLFELSRAPVDIALWYSNGHHPGLETRCLLQEEIFPACSPALLDGSLPLAEPADLRHHALLHDVGWRDDWKRWLKAAGVAGVNAGRGSSFTLYSMALQAAVGGLGVLMAHSALVTDDLAAGRLVEPFELRLPAPLAYHMVTTREAAERPAVTAFRDWLMAEAEG